MDYEIKADVEIKGALEDSFDAVTMTPERPMLGATLVGDGGRASFVDVLIPVWNFPSALLAADRGAGLSEVAITVCQIGSRGISTATSMKISVI